MPAPLAELTKPAACCFAGPRVGQMAMMNLQAKRWIQQNFPYWNRCWAAGARAATIARALLLSGQLSGLPLTAGALLCAPQDQRRGSRLAVQPRRGRVLGADRDLQHLDHPHALGQAGPEPHVRPLLPGRGPLMRCAWLPPLCCQQPQQPPSPASRVPHAVPTPPTRLTTTRVSLPARSTAHSCRRRLSLPCGAADRACHYRRRRS